MIKENTWKKNNPEKPSQNIFKIADFKVNSEKPFEGDKLKRNVPIANLTKLIQNWTGPLVMAINSPWGTGKTTFVKMWQASLIKQEYTTIYYNAWENDYSDEPLGTLLAAIGSTIKNDQSALAKTFKTVAKKGLQIGSKILPMLLKAFTSGLIDLTDLEIKGLDVAALTKQIADEEIKAFQNRKKTMEDFKKELGKFANEVTKDGKALVFFIDELDRCRPDFAIQILEKVKHFFGIDKIVFILSIDRQQLEHSVTKVYGNSDVDGYLRKFIDLNYQLPKPDVDEYVIYLCNTFIIDTLTFDVKVLQLFFKLFNFSLRTQEQCFSQIYLILQTNKSITNHSSFLIALLCLRNKDYKI